MHLFQVIFIDKLQPAHTHTHSLAKENAQTNAYLSLVHKQNIIFDAVNIRGVGKRWPPLHYSIENMRIFMENFNMKYKMHFVEHLSTGATETA